MLAPVTSLARRAGKALSSDSGERRPLATIGVEALSSIGVRAALIGGSLATGSLFWVRASLGQNQLKMHDCSRDGNIEIGGVPEQLYGEGFIAAWHEVLEEELGDRAPEALYKVGKRGAHWEVQRAIDRKVWVPAVLRPLVGRPEMLEKVKTSRVYRAVLKECLQILFRMIMTEGGWGRVEVIDLGADPMRLEVSNTPEPRRMGHTGSCSCYLMTGIYTGYFETLFGTEFKGVETSCVSRGDPRCTFELSPGRR